MKKTFLFMMIIILIISIPVSLFAEETSDESLNKRDLFDALKVDYNMIKEVMCNYSINFRDTINTINFEEDVTIIKAMRASPSSEFGRYSTIDGILEDKYTRLSSERYPPYFYVIFIDGNPYDSLYILDDLSVRVAWFDYKDKALSFLLDNKVLKYLPSETIVSNVLYFFGEEDTSSECSALYYFTNNGDYVYHIDGSSGKEYIFPSNVFFDLMKKVLEKYLADVYTDGGNYTIKDVGDFPEYQIGSDSFFLKENYHNPETVDASPMMYSVALLSIVVLGILLKNNRISITGNVPGDKHK